MNTAAVYTFALVHDYRASRNPAASSDVCSSAGNNFLDFHRVLFRGSFAFLLPLPSRSVQIFDRLN